MSTFFKVNGSTTDFIDYWKATENQIEDKIKKCLIGHSEIGSTVGNPAKNILDHCIAAKNTYNFGINEKINCSGFIQIVGVPLGPKSISHFIFNSAEEITVYAENQYNINNVISLYDIRINYSNVYVNESNQGSSYTLNSVWMLSI